jgi:predicted lipoprotein with Yx(FWY)xxD motif
MSGEKEVQMNDKNNFNRIVRAHRISWRVRLASAMSVIGAVAISSVVAVTAGAASSSIVSTSKTAQYGTILVSGDTVYTLEPSKVACGAACLKIWPAVLLPKGVATATAGSGVNSARLGTVKVSGGSRQVTYGGKRLYYFVEDTAPREVKGNLTDEWGKWSVVVTVKPAHSSSGSGSTQTTSAGSGGVSF